MVLDTQVDTFIFAPFPVHYVVKDLNIIVCISCMIINTFPLLHLPLSKQYLDIVQSALSFFEREAEEKDIKKRKKKKVINSKLQRTT